MKQAILVGDPVSGSLSPRLFQYWFNSLKISGRYEAKQGSLDILEQVCTEILLGNVVGANVTAPLKLDAFHLADVHSETAKASRAVNVLALSDGRLKGFNTDAEGFLKGFGKMAPGVSLKGKRTVVLGAGGGARAALSALDKAGAGNISVVARNRDKLQKLRESLKTAAFVPVHWEQKDDCLKSADLLVNATPADQGGQIAQSFDIALLPARAIVYDLAYGGNRTPLVNAALERNLFAFDGLGMLVFQAIPAFELWFGTRPDYSEVLVDFLRAGAKNT